MSPAHSPKPTPTRNRVTIAKKVGMLFAHLKRILGLARLRLRGPSGAQFEFTLAAMHKTCGGSPSWPHSRRRKRQWRALRERGVACVVFV
jgi:hypothetical protein